jgi:hypothetical protein
MVYNKNLKLQHIKRGNKYNTLFLPGLPGDYRDRPFTNDLKLLGSNIYSVVYPGTYGMPGKLSVETTTQSIVDALNELSIQKKPIIVVGYSYSTMLIPESIKGMDNIIFILNFSPIFDLNNSINEDFKETCKWLDRQDGFNLDFASFNTHIDSASIIDDYIGSIENIISEEKIPLIYSVGNKDNVLKHDYVIGKLNSLNSNNRLNRIFLYEVEDGVHKLDSIYNNSLRRLLFAFIFSHEIGNIFPECSCYAWGSTLNYRYASDVSDIDIAIIGKYFSYSDYTVINKLIKKYSEKYNVTIDVIVNTFAEMNTSSKIRSNRGPSFIHEIKYHYPLLRKGLDYKTADISRKDLIEDARNANDTNLYKSKKALLNYPPGSSSSNWIIKDFIYGTYYKQYLLGNMYPNQNHIEDYYKESMPEIYSALKTIIMSKKNNFKDVDLAFLKKVLELHESLKI